MTHIDDVPLLRLDLCNDRCIPPQLLALIKELPGRVERELLGAEDADYGLVARHTATTETTTDAADAVSDAGSEGSSSGNEYDADDSSSSTEHPADCTVRHCAYTHFLTWLLLLKHIHRYTPHCLSVCHQRSFWLQLLLLQWH
jgi:hypothetical protein